MFENILYQEVTNSIASDIKSGIFPQAVLLSGPHASGKLTAALEIARSLSCAQGGAWQCTCPSCVRIKQLITGDIMLMGHKDCSLEIAAAKDAFLKALMNNASHIDAVRHLFLRAVRKETMRFSPILWDGDADANKAAAIVGEIDELMDAIDYPRELSDTAVVEKTLDKIEEHCTKAETSLLYDTIPVRMVRNVSFWARMKSTNKRVIIIEAADKMLDGVRNSLLKILEEPPQDAVFILTTAHRTAVMPTILSRVRTYTFRERTADEVAEVISRVFHGRADSIDATGAKQLRLPMYLEQYLPVKPCDVQQQARDFIGCIANAAGERVQFPQTATIVKACASFKPRVLLNIFMEELSSCVAPLTRTTIGCEAAAECMSSIRECMSQIGTYNISSTAALESLFVSLSRINRNYENCMRGIA